MKLSLNWIKDYVDLPANLEMKELAHQLTMRTVEVEGYERLAETLAQIVLARILRMEAHPNADQLRVCFCDAGAAGELQIVCGGSNLYVGEWIALALPGARVVWHGEGEPVKIKAGKLRGVRSDGMICASSELGLADLFPAGEEHEILDLTDFEIKERREGQPLVEALELDDIILEIDNKSMTHRPDLWGHYGMARELAAIYGCPLRELPSADSRSFGNVPELPLEIEDETRCRRYTAACFEGLKVAPSPYWLRKRLLLAGMRPINNIVDLTNYIMLSTGQPTHAFDADHVQLPIRVRRAKAGEELLLLDDKKVRLDEDDLLITDAKGPLALAGIMGGKHDSIFPETERIILELATFDAMSVRRSQQRHRQRTESSTRFEKNIDTARTELCFSLFLTLAADLFPSLRLTAFRDLCPSPTKPAEMEVGLSFLESRSGKKLSFETVESCLRPLGFRVTRGEGDLLRVVAPVFRSTGDIEGPYDILEEVARMTGYENFSFTAPSISLEAALPQRESSLRQRAAEYLAFRCGYDEIVSYPWPEERYVRLFCEDTGACACLEDPPAPEMRFLRPSLLPGLLAATEHNAKFFREFKIFERSQVFRLDPAAPLGLRQEHELAGLCFGPTETAEAMYREMKGLIEQMGKEIRCEELCLARLEKPCGADPKVWMNIVRADEAPRAPGKNRPAPEIIGNLYLLSGKAHKEADLKRSAVFVFDLKTERLHALPSRDNCYQPLPAREPLEENLSVLLDEQTPWSEIERCIGKKVRHLEFLEAYRGKQIPEGKKSIHFRFYLPQEEAQLTMDEIDAKLKSLVRILEKELGAELRG